MYVNWSKHSQSHAHIYKIHKGGLTNNSPRKMDKVHNSTLLQSAAFYTHTT